MRCVDQNGNMIGILDTREAMKLASQAGLDLVEISPNADPPVCRIMDFGKYKYQESQKEKEARRHQQAMVVKETKFHATIADHDFMTKVGHIREFLTKGYRVKIVLTFRGRENAHKDVGFEVVNRVIRECQDIGAIEMVPRVMGHSIIAMLVGKRKDQAKQAGQKQAPSQAPLPSQPPASGGAEKTQGKSLDEGGAVS